MFYANEYLNKCVHPNFNHFLYFVHFLVNPSKYFYFYGNNISYSNVNSSREKIILKNS